MQNSAARRSGNRGTTGVSRRPKLRALIPPVLCPQFRHFVLFRGRQVEVFSTLWLELDGSCWRVDEPCRCFTYRNDRSHRYPAFLTLCVSRSAGTHSHIPSKAQARYPSKQGGPLRTSGQPFPFMWSKTQLCPEAPRRLPDNRISAPPNGWRRQGSPQNCPSDAKWASPKGRRSVMTNLLRGFVSGHDFSRAA